VPLAALAARARAFHSWWVRRSNAGVISGSQRYNYGKKKDPDGILGGAEGTPTHRTGRACSCLTGSWGSHDASPTLSCARSFRREQLEQLRAFETVDCFTAEERSVIRLAKEMTLDGLRLGLFVRFSHDCRAIVRFGVVVFVFVLGIIIIVVVGVSRRHHANEAPVGEPGGNVLENAWGHGGSCRMSRHSWTDVSARGRDRQMRACSLGTRQAGTCRAVEWLDHPQRRH
jgi:hypothetical protein